MSGEDFGFIITYLCAMSRFFDNLIITPYLKLPKTSVIFFSIHVERIDTRKTEVVKKKKKPNCVKISQIIIKYAQSSCFNSK